MDIQKTMDQINAIDREKSQLDLLLKQAAEQRADITKRMADAGVTAENIDGKIAELEAKIEAQLAAVRGAAAPVDHLGTLAI